jgi:hypothetical protein
VRREILARLEDQPEDEMVSEDWCTEEHRVRELAADTYLFTYVLHGQGRAPAWGDRAARFLVPADRVAGGVWADPGGQAAAGVDHGDRVSPAGGWSADPVADR